MLLEMIFGNLMDNAIKYGGAKPVVQVSTRKRSSDRIVVRIMDNGEGIPHESRNKVFRLFHREGDEVARRSKGTGLGLHIVKTLIGLLRGRVAVESRPDGESGCVFTVELPIKARLTRKERQAELRIKNSSQPSQLVASPR